MKAYIDLYLHLRRQCRHGRAKAFAKTLWGWA